MFIKPLESCRYEANLTNLTKKLLEYVCTSLRRAAVAVVSSSSMQYLRSSMQYLRNKSPSLFYLHSKTEGEETV